MIVHDLVCDNHYKTITTKIHFNEMKQPNYLSNSNSPQCDDVQSSSASFQKNKLSMTLQRNDESRHLIKAFQLEDNDPLVLVPLSMLQLGVSRSRASREMYQHSQTKRFSPSDSVTNAITSQRHPNSFVKTGQYSSSIAENQRPHQNIQCAEKMSRNNLREAKYLHNVKNKMRKRRGFSRTTSKDAKVLCSIHKKAWEKTKAQENLQDYSILCKVCGDGATKYNHYGGRSCAGCRIFFKRSVEQYNRYNLPMLNRFPSYYF